MTLGESGGARSVPDFPQSSIFLPLPLGPTLLLEGTYRDFLELLYSKEETWPLYYHIPQLQD